MKILLLIYIGLISQSALAQTVEQRNALKHIAEAKALSEICPSMHLNSDLVTRISLYWDLREQKDAALIAKNTAERDILPFRGHTDAACMAAMLMFGPDGKNISNLLGRGLIMSEA